jgi:short-chain 2-methylacyl-CoA dehydrogenase
MEFGLSDDHRLLRDTVREFATQEIAPVAEELDRTKSFPYEIVKRLGELDLMGIPFPAHYGGAGADTLAYALAVEELARIDSSVAITLCAHPRWELSPFTYSDPSSRSRSGCRSYAAATGWGRSV